MSNGYSATLKGGQQIYINNWKPLIAYQNLIKAGKYIGVQNLISMAELNLSTAFISITEAKDAEVTSQLIEHFVCTVNMDERKITKQTFNEEFEGNIFLALEIFCHVIKSQYSDFFEQGLAEELSQSQ